MFFNDFLTHKNLVNHWQSPFNLRWGLSNDTYALRWSVHREAAYNGMLRLGAT